MTYKDFFGQGTRCTVGKPHIMEFINFYVPQLYRKVLLRRVLAMGILSVCLSVRLSQPGGVPSPGEIETPGLHRVIA